MSRRASRRGAEAFTMVELMVSVAVLAILILVIAQLFNSAALVTTSENKRIDADTQARVVLDRMSVDFAQIVKRNDVDYFLKSAAISGSTPSRPFPGDDLLAFYSEVPGYSDDSVTPVSLVTYRMKPASASAPRALERLGKGLVFGSPTEPSMVYLPLTIEATWPGATTTTSTDPHYEIFGPQVFRFEYYYILTGTTLDTGTVLPSAVSDVPWNASIPGHVAPSGLRDVAAIVVNIAIIDPKSRVLVTDDQLDAVAAKMLDFDPATMRDPGDLVEQWNAVLNNPTDDIPRTTAAAIRVYSRHFTLDRSN
jgi:type II secretory pathway pseudopilin PulG